MTVDPTTININPVKKKPMVFTMSKILTCVVKRYKWQLQNQAHKHIQSFTQQEQKLEIAIVRQNS